MNLTFRLRLLALLVILLAGTGCAIYWWQLLDSHQRLRSDTLVQTGERAAQLADALAEEVEAIMRGADIVLQHLSGQYASATRSSFDAAARRAHEAFPAGAVRQISVIDRSGNLVYSDVPFVASRYLGDSEAYRAQLGRTASDRMFIGRPVRQPGSGEWAIPLSRAIFEKGRLIGVLGLSLAPEYVSGHLAKLALGSGDVVTLIRSDGPFLARSRDLADTLGKDSPVDRPFMRPDAPAQGVYESPGTIDKLDRVFAYHRLDTYPLTIFVGLGKANALAPVNEIRARSMWRNGISVAVVVILAIGSALLLLRFARQQEALSESESRYKTLVESEPECVKVLDANGALVHMNRAGLDLIDADSLDQVLGKEVAELVLPEHRSQFVGLTKSVFEGHSGKLEFEIRSLKGVHHWLETSAVPLRNPQGEITALLAITRDISDRKRMERELQEIAATDFLTGLPNRRHFIARMEEELARMQRLDAQRAAVLMLDLDHFKRVNDRLGHASGDVLLKNFAALVRQELRKNDIAGRIGGEEFAIILPGADARAAHTFAERLRRKVAETPLLGDGHSAPLTVSIGIAAMKAGDANVDAALARADEALYRAKKGGRNRVRTFADTASQA